MEGSSKDEFRLGMFISKWGSASPQELAVHINCISGGKMPKDIDLKVANVCVTIKFYEDYQEEMIREAESMEIERLENSETNTWLWYVPKKLSKISWNYSLKPLVNLVRAVSSNLNFMDCHWKEKGRDVGKHVQCILQIEGFSLSFTHTRTKIQLPVAY